MKNYVFYEVALSPIRQNDWRVAWLCALASFSTILVAWEVAGWLEFRFVRVLPPPSSFLSEMWESDFQIGLGKDAPTVHESIIATFIRVFFGLLFGFVFGLITGYAIGVSKWVRRFVMPVVQVLAPIAPIAWIPLALVLLGIGDQTAIFIVFMGVYFMLTIATVDAIDNVPDEQIDAARTLGATERQLWFHVKFPYVLPQVFTILRINFFAAWMAVLAAEMTGLRDGLGAIIMIGRNLFNNNWILFGMCLIGVAGFLGDLALSTIQRVFFWWGDK